MTSLLRLSLACLLAAGVAGCTDDAKTPKAGPGCTSPGCLGQGQDPAGGSGGNDGSGGSDSGVSDIQGTVRLMADPAFSAFQSTAWDGEATISIEPQSGKPGVDVEYTPGSAFLLEEVPDGAAWVVVTAELAGEVVLSTVTALDVPPSGPIVAPVVDYETVDKVAQTLLGQPQLDEGKAHIVLFLRRGGGALGGADVDESTVPGALIAYDNGESSAYSSDLQNTGDFGKVVILNVVPPAGGKLLVDVVDLDGERFSLPVRIQPNAIAVLGYTLDK